MPLTVILISILKEYVSWFDLRSQDPKMDELKVIPRHVMLWEFINNQKIFLKC